MRLASRANQCRSAATAKGSVLTSGWLGVPVVSANAQYTRKTTVDSNHHACTCVGSGNLRTRAVAQASVSVAHALQGRRRFSDLIDLRRDWFYFTT